MAPPQRQRNLWRLHVPLAVALFVCGLATFIEFNRAADGVGRAWVYTIQWPMFGLFAVWMWVRYRREAKEEQHTPRVNPFSGMVAHWQTNVAEAEAEAEDPELAAWQRHVAELRRQDAERMAPRDPA